MIEFGRILIVDDSAMMRTIVRKSLEMAKVRASEVVEAKNGLEAWHQLEKQPFDIMFCDLNMPEMSGDELIERLMIAGSIAIPPVVIVSSEASTERVDCLKCDQIIGVLRKPFSPEKIVTLFSQATKLLRREMAQ
jgi:two-component system, chemotaxis family, chemotaxis protein CheY